MGDGSGFTVRSVEISFVVFPWRWSGRGESWAADEKCGFGGPSGRMSGGDGHRGRFEQTDRQASLAVYLDSLHRSVRNYAWGRAGEDGRHQKHMVLGICGCRLVGSGYFV